MSYVVARMQKMKSSNLGGIYRHNERVFENHSNKDIDIEKSHLNYELTNRDRSVPYDKQIKKYINDNKLSKRAIRKDAVLCNEWIITSDKSFFEDMTQKETKDFFITAKNYFAEKYGEDNIAYASVHLDESTPHMHLGIVPMKDGKLSSKALFGDRDQLKQIQDEFPQYLNEQGFNVQRGESGSQKKHLKTAEFKEKQRMLESTDKTISDKVEQLTQLEQREKQVIGKIESKEKELKLLSESLPDLQDIQLLKLEELQQNGLSKKTLDGKLKVDRNTFNSLFQTAHKNLLANIKLKQQKNVLETRLNQSIQYQNNLAKELMKHDRIVSENRELKTELGRLTQENSQLKSEIKRLGENLKILGEKLSIWRKTAKLHMSHKEFRQVLHRINQIRLPKVPIVSVVRNIKNIVEKNLF